VVLRTLYQTLLDSDPARLRVIAQQWDIALQATRKTDMAAELADAMASADTIAGLLDRLTPDQRAALDDLLRRGGTLPWAIFVRRWGEIRPAGPGRVEREALWQAPVSPAEALWFLGVVQRAFLEQDALSAEMAFVPGELRLYMPDPAPIVTPAPPQTATPPYVIPGTDALADDLVTLWIGLQRSDDAHSEPPVVSAQPRIALLETLCIEQSWLRRDAGALRPVPSAIVAWLRDTPWRQWASLAQAWVTSAAWNDLAYVPTLAPDPVQAWPNDPVSTRQGLIGCLRLCELAKWYDIQAFISYVHTHSPDFLRPTGDYQSWAPRDVQSGVPLRGFEAWTAVEGALIAYILSGPLAWLGLVDLGSLSPEVAPAAFRLTQAGAALLLGAPPPELPEPPPLQAGAHGEFVAPPRRRYERFQLSRIADSVPRDKGYAYRLSPSSLDRAKQQRIPYARIVTFLEEASGGAPLPAPIRGAIQRAYQGEARASLEHLWVLRVQDPQHLKIPTVQALVDQVIGPNMAIVRGDRRERLLQVLADHGILADIVERD